MRYYNEKLMKNIFLLTIIFSLFNSITFASYTSLETYLGEDKEYVQNNHLERYNLDWKIDKNGNDVVYYGYRDSFGILHVESLTFDDYEMGIRFLSLREFNDYNILKNVAAIEDYYLHNVGTVHYKSNGTAWASNWQYIYFYRIEGYNIYTGKAYTDRGAYKARSELIDKKFDRIRNGYYDSPYY